MSYADGLLATGERIIHREKQHPFVFVWGARWTILAVIGAIVLFWLGGNLGTDGFSGTMRTVIGWITAILFFGGLVVFAWTALRYVNQEYVLTNRRVIQVEGVLNRNSTDSSLEKINDAVLSQSFIGRMFDFGDLTVLTASESAIDRMHMLRRPIGFKKAMLDAKHEYEVDTARAGWAPGPPIREGASPAQQAGGPVGPPTEPVAAPVPAMATAGGATPAAAPAAPSADPDEITRTLSNLADLRDRGAISAEEYESKKAELLGRL
jgi:PH (Pleckstrin Homology) domain-containing protein/putative oligomerization/nucleic acid binding protein